MAETPGGRFNLNKSKRSPASMGGGLRDTIRPANLATMHDDPYKAMTDGFRQMGERRDTIQDAPDARKVGAMYAARLKSPVRDLSPRQVAIRQAPAGHRQI
jgi:hypothetical protein